MTKKVVPLTEVIKDSSLINFQTCDEEDKVNDESIVVKDNCDVKREDKVKSMVSRFNEKSNCNAKSLDVCKSNFQCGNKDVSMIILKLS